MKKVNVNILEKLKNIPTSPGVYRFFDSNRTLIYIGKATNLKSRVSSYFQKAHDAKTAQLVQYITDIKFKQTDSVLEALILESELIKKFQPHYNIKLKDDKSFVNIYVTKELYSRVIIERPTNIKKKIGNLKFWEFGPFTSALIAEEILLIIRKIFGYRDCTNTKFLLQTKKNRPCMFYSITKCSGPCVNIISQSQYKKNINKIIFFLKGNRAQLIKQLEKEMVRETKKQNFEKAIIIRNQIFALRHLKEANLLKNDFYFDNQPDRNYRIEGFDISNISGHNTTGSMVVFEGNIPNKNLYRRFKINSKVNSDDLEATRELITRRLGHMEWPLPDLIVIDGGINQFNVVKKVFSNINLKTDMPTIISLCKNKKRQISKIFTFNLKKIKLDNNQIIEISKKVNAEAHRFAIYYQRKLTRKSLQIN